MAGNSFISWLQKPFGVNLFEDVSGRGLAIFRIGFGLVMLYEMINMRAYVMRDLLASKFFLRYDLFQWIEPLPESVMDLFLTAGGLATLFVVLGYKFRTAQLLVALSWTYIFLLDRGHYNNHYYLYSIVNFVMVFSGANRQYSLDAALNRDSLPSTVHYWQYLLIRLQVFILYFYGAIAKMNSDWLKGWPVRKWLTEGIGEFPDWYANFVTSEVGVYFYAYGGIVFDLLIGFTLLHKRWRYWSIPVIFFFHISNHFFWNIGTFPWFSIMVTSIFFDPDWPEKFGKWLGIKSQAVKTATPNTISSVRRSLIATVFATFMVIQVLAPLRQFIYGGDPGWHGYGHLFSWRMMLVDTVSGLKVKVKDEGDDEFVQVAMEDYITYRQFRKSARVPSSFLDFAHYIRDEMIKGGAQNPVVEMEIYKSFNGRPYALLTDTTVNYANIEKTYFSVPNWIEPGNQDEEPGYLWHDVIGR